MTNKEAVFELKMMKRMIKADSLGDVALDLAIEALKRPTGKWKIAENQGWFSDIYICSCCGNTLDFRGVNGGRGSSNFCPNCGADMQGGSQ